MLNPMFISRLCLTQLDITTVGSTNIISKCNYLLTICLTFASDALTKILFNCKLLTDTDNL